MAYTGLQMFMDNLKQLINGHHDPLIINNPMILSERPRFQLLYQELASIIQTLFSIHHQPELEKIKDLKKRFKDAAEEAQDIINLFLSALHFKNKGLYTRSDAFEIAQALEKVMRSIESIKGEFMTINIDNMKIHSSPRFDCVNTPSTTAETGTSPLGTTKLLEEIVVGLDHDAELIRDKLVEDQKKLDVVSIVGMGGIGKTTLATKVFNDRFIVYHFQVRAWATVTQTYIKRDFLIQILASIGVQQNFAKANDSQLRGKLHKNLMGKRYLIVIDDIWNIDAWDDLKLFFPRENTGSRILLTSRLNEVALYVKPHGFIHSLPYLTKEESWELLREKVFHGDECPEWLIKPGMQIAKKCHGLPLSVVVMAGALTKEAKSKILWENIACSVGSYFVSGQKRNLESLALSYHHLPYHLRECFLYLGGFPEDFRIEVSKLIWLWVAEGFIEEDGNRSLEDIAKAYLIDLIDRNLVIIAERKFNGDVKACKLHDLVRELCLQKAIEEGLFLKIESPPLWAQRTEVITTYKQRRMFTNHDIKIVNFPHPHATTIRSLLCFHMDKCLINDIAEHYRSFALLRVLDLQMLGLDYFPEGIALLVHLRYLAFWHLSGFPSSVCSLWSLQTLIVKTSHATLYLPSNISNLVNLRHLWSNKKFSLPSIENPMNLQSISNVLLGDGVDISHIFFPGIKKLAFTCKWEDKNYFKSLAYLETLKLRGGLCKNRIWFPVTLKKLTLLKCGLPWSDMSIIQSLPNLEVLKLKHNAFEGTQWNASEQQFPQLKFLRLQSLNIEQWDVCSTSFPHLKRLVVWACWDFQEIPLEIGEIATLELIETDSMLNYSVVESVKKIQKEQYDEGNTDLKITVDGLELSIYLSGKLS